MSNIYEVSIAEAGHPLNHGMYTPLMQRISSLCLVNQVTAEDGFFSFLPRTVLKPNGHDGKRVRPVQFGDATHFVSDYLASSTPMLQVEVQSEEDPKPQTVTYVVPSEGQMVILQGKTLHAERWRDFEALAVTDSAEFIDLLDLLADTVFQISDRTTCPNYNGNQIGPSNLKELGQSMFPDVD